MAYCTAPSEEGKGFRTLSIASTVLAVAVESAFLISTASSASLRDFLTVGRRDAETRGDLGFVLIFLPGQVFA